MRKYFKTWISNLLIAALLLVWLGLAQAQQQAQAGSMSNLRGQRYCEIFLATQHAGRPQIKVFNTIGLNQCPSEQWDKITPQGLKTQTKAFYAQLNGPRYWTIDGIQNSGFVNPNVMILGGISMRQAAILKLRWIDFLRSQKPYELHQVQRRTTWIYKAGQPVFELIDADKKVYIMQSYSTQKINQTAASLADLGGKLKLPEGWSFRTRILQKDAFLTPVEQKAVIVQDDLTNTYQQETPGF